MPKRTSSQSHIRNIQKGSNSYYITIPIRLMKKFGWRKWQKVVVREDRRGLLIRDWKKPLPKIDGAR